MNIDNNDIDSSRSTNKRKTDATNNRSNSAVTYYNAGSYKNNNDNNNANENTNNNDNNYEAKEQ